MAFTVDGYSINDGGGGYLVSLTNGIGQIDVASGATAIISAGISSNSGLTKTNSGALGLTGSLSGTTASTLNVETGTMVASSSESWQNVEVVASGSLAVQGSSAALIASGSITVDGTVVNAGGTIETPTLTIDSTGTFRDAAGSVSGSVGALTVIDYGTFISVTDQSLAGATGSFFNYGTYEFDNASGSGTLTLALAFASSNGTFDIVSGTLSIPNTIWLMNGETTTFNGPGTLSVPTLDVAQATFLQNSGTLNVTNSLSIGDHWLSGATYDLAGGAVNAGTLYIGCYSTATFTQTGGTLSSGAVLIGQYANGTFDQSAGTDSFWAVYMGDYGQGTWNFSGGTDTASIVSIGHYGTGTMTISGTASFTDTGYIAAAEGAGSSNATITQEGNSTVTTGDLGVGTGGTGVYNMLGGSLYATFSTIGAGINGEGTFIQTGGSVGDYVIYLGDDGSSYYGRYNLSGGQFTVQANADFANNGGNAAFTQTGGTSDFQGALVAGVGGDTCNITLSGGSMSVAGEEYIGYSSAATMNQTGGTLSMSLDLIISGTGWDGAPAGVGTYLLSGTGQSSSQYILLAYTNTGFLTHTGGTLTTDIMTINGPDGATGTYANTGGTFNGWAINILAPSDSGLSEIAEGAPYTLGLSATDTFGSEAITSPLAWRWWDFVRHRLRRPRARNGAEEISGGCGNIGSPSNVKNPVFGTRL